MSVLDTVRPPRKGGEVGRRPLWLLAPGGLLLLLVIGVPLGFAIFISLTDLDQYTLRRWTRAPFVGAGNFVEALTGTDLFHSIWLSVSASVLITAITLPVGILAALAVHNALPGRSLVRALFLIPYVLPAFVTGTVWRTLLQPDGAVNNALALLGLGSGNWLTGAQTYWTMVLVTVWSSWPFVYLFALSGLQSLGADVMEAASLDGAGWRQKLRHIVLPHLKGPIALAAILAILHHLNEFTIPFVMFGSPAPAPVNLLSLLSYSTSFETFRFGLSSAMAVFSLILIAIPLLVYLRAVRLDPGSGR